MPDGYYWQMTRKMSQDYDFYIVTWKVLSLLNKTGMLKLVIKEVEKYKTDIADICLISDVC
jgi:hypothetical protein